MKPIFIKAGLLLLTIFLMQTAVAQAQNEGPLFNEVCNRAPESPVCQQAAEQSSQGASNPVVELINSAANIIALVAGIAAVITIIISGFIFITAGGTGFKSQSQSPTRAAKARATLVGALLGLVVIALAWAITRFITNQVIQ